MNKYSNEARCETGRKLVLPRLATGRIFEAPEIYDNGGYGSLMPAA